MTSDNDDKYVDQLLAAFLDACRDGDREAAVDALHVLRLRVWGGSPLPRDPRTDPAELARLTRDAALWRERVRVDHLMTSVADPGKPHHALGPAVRARTAAFPFCVDPVGCLARGGRCQRDPVCGN
jgi:hypothetical protein